MSEPDCRVVGCFYKRNSEQAGLLPCQQPFGGSPELVRETFRHCAVRIEEAYEILHADELKRRVF